MKRHEVEMTGGIEEKRNQWGWLFHLTLFVVVACGLLGGWLAGELVANLPVLLPAAVAIGGMGGGCLGFAGCVLVAVRLGWR